LAGAHARLNGLSSAVTFVARPEARNDTIELTVVVPAWNEALRLPILLASLVDHVDVASTEVLVVDDGSEDRTVEVARGFESSLPHLRVIEHGTNHGKGAAVRTGVLQARGRLVAFVDADDATDLSSLRPMCDAIVGPVGAVFGSRHVDGSVVSGSPPIRGLMGRVFNHVVRVAAGTNISDTQCGAKVFRTSVAAIVFADSTVDGFAFDVEILRRLMDLEVEVVEHPVRWSYVSGSKIQLVTPIRMLTDIARLRFGRSRFEPASVTCSFAPELLAFAEPLDGTKPAIGSEVRVLVNDASLGTLRRRVESLGPGPS
jgi:dolichyl-phosphate beta-glucosyltransferase